VKLANDVRNFFAAHGSTGGKSKSQDKRDAAVKNLERARAKRRSQQTECQRTMAAKRRRNMLPKSHASNGRNERRAGT